MKQGQKNSANAHETRDNSSSKTARFKGGTQISHHRTEDSLNLKGRNLKLLKSTFCAENFIRRLSRSISSDYGTITLEMCVTA